MWIMCCDWCFVCKMCNTFHHCSRDESILLFLVQTVGRQSIEQRQYRATRPRSATRKTPSSEMGEFFNNEMDHTLKT